MCYYNLRQLGLLQITTTFITIYDSLVITILDNCYYNLRRLLLQFTTGITIHDRADVSNFRPITYLPLIRKLFTGVLADNL